MALVRNVKKPSRVVRALKQMKSGFLSEPETEMLFCRHTKFVFENYKGDQPMHPKIILGKSCHTSLLFYPPVNYCPTAKFHHLAENALMAWAMCNKNAEAIKPTPESVSSLRNYAKDVDSKGAPPLNEKKDEKPKEVPTPMFHPIQTDDSAGDARFAEAKRILKEKRISKEMHNPTRSPFDEP